MELLLFFITMTCIVDIAFNLYILELISSISLGTIIAVLHMVFATNLTFAYYYLSEWMTRDLAQIGEHFFNSPWYRVLSAKEQRLLAFAIQQAQREIRLRGLGLFDGSLTVFSSVFATLNGIGFASGTRLGYIVTFCVPFFCRFSERVLLISSLCGDLNELDEHVRI